MGEIDHILKIREGIEHMLTCSQAAISLMEKEHIYKQIEETVDSMIEQLPDDRTAAIHSCMVCALIAIDSLIHSYENSTPEERKAVRERIMN